jgi:hypothetical protein
MCRFLNMNYQGWFIVSNKATIHCKWFDYIHGSRLLMNIVLTRIYMYITPAGDSDKFFWKWIYL